MPDWLFIYRSQCLYKQLAQYHAIIDELGRLFNLPVIQLQPAFNWAMRSKPGSKWEPSCKDWASDRVHPAEEVIC